MMKVIGLTGGIGSGKSTVASIFNECGAYIIDADKIAKEAVRRGKKMLEELVQNFGVEILNLNGELDRSKLADIVFEDPKKLIVLNEIAHSEVFKRIIEEIDRLRVTPYEGLVILDVPIPTQEIKDMCDEIWVVDADMEERLERIIERNGYSEEEARKRINAQMTREEYLGIADKVIENKENLGELKKKINAICMKVSTL